MEMLKFEISTQMAAIIGNALAKQPYEVVAPVLTELQRQIDAQQRQPEAVMTAAEKPE